MNTYRDFSDRLTFSIDYEASEYRALVNLATKRFDLSPVGNRIAGMDDVFQDFTKGNLVVELGWDNWMCFTIVAKGSDSEALAKEIAQFLGP